MSSFMGEDYESIEMKRFSGLAASCEVFGKNEGTQLENCYNAQWFIVGQRPAMA